MDLLLIRGGMGFLEEQGAPDLQLHPARFEGFGEDEFRFFSNAGMNELNSLWLQLAISQGNEEIDRPQGWKDQVASPLGGDQIGSNRNEVFESSLDLMACNGLLHQRVDPASPTFSIRGIGEDDVERTRREDPFQLSEILFENGYAIFKVIQDHIFLGTFYQSALNFNTDKRMGVCIL